MAEDWLSARSGTAVSLAADTTFGIAVRGIFVGTGGTVIGRLVGDGADATFKNVPSGGELAYAFKIIRSTANGTTAADIVALR